MESKMKTIYLTKAYSGDGLLIVLLGLKDDKPETLQQHYPNLFHEVHESIIDCNMEVTTYNTGITHFWDHSGDRAYGRIRIRVGEAHLYPALERSVQDKLKSLFTQLGYAVSSEIPD